ncbi:MAG TPA: SAM-dependent methyltransferase, partial [Enterobacteriaceae bacterium]|nr:SAM-dependent methyltransferase [Enterobacteriaceae bacterium]
IRLYQNSASQAVKAYFELQDSGSFTSDIVFIEAKKR